MPEPLSMDQIAGLLKTEKPTQRQSQKQNQKPRPIQLGPLRYVDKTEKCVSRGCSSPTMVRVDGAAYCSQHALYMLNHLIIEIQHGPEWLAQCTCNAGKSTKQHTHTSDCILYQNEKAHDSSFSSATTNTAS